MALREMRRLIEEMTACLDLGVLAFEGLKIYDIASGEFERAGSDTMKVFWGP